MPKPFSFADEAKKADSGSYLKLKEGNNKIRIVTEFVLHESTFKDKVTGAEKKTKKFVGFVLDRADGTFKPAFLAKTIVDSVADLQLSDEYAFDGVPMPYDINIRAVGAGTKEVIYNVLPMPPTALTEVNLADIAKLDVADFIAKLTEEQTPKADPFIKPEDMPKADPEGEELDMSNVPL